MKYIIITIYLCSIFCFTLCAAEKGQQQTPVNQMVGKKTHQISITSKGETILSANFPKFNVSVNFNTREVNIGKPSDQRPDTITTCCTYSKYPCSIVDRISVTVNGNQIFVPRSVYCSLADLNMAKIEMINNVGVLTLNGGDASESFIVKIEFNEQQINKKTLCNGEAPDKPLEESVYHAVEVGD
jgi:hypothetical protein